MQAIGVFSVLFSWAGVHFLLAARPLERDLDQYYSVNTQSSAARADGPAFPTR
jgi:hypothetical protein